MIRAISTNVCCSINLLESISVLFWLHNDVWSWPSRRMPYFAQNNVHCWVLHGVAHGHASAIGWSAFLKDKMSKHFNMTWPFINFHFLELSAFSCTVTGKGYFFFILQQLVEVHVPLKLRPKKLSSSSSHDLPSLCLSWWLSKLSLFRQDTSKC